MSALDLAPYKLIDGPKVVCRRVESERSRKAYAAREVDRLRALREMFL